MRAYIYAFYSESVNQESIQLEIDNRREEVSVANEMVSNRLENLDTQVTNLAKVVALLAQFMNLQSRRIDKEMDLVRTFMRTQLFYFSRGELPPNFREVFRVDPPLSSRPLMVAPRLEASQWTAMERDVKRRGRD